MNLHNPRTQYRHASISQDPLIIPCPWNPDRKTSHPGHSGFSRKGIFHGTVSNQNRPYIRTGLRHHQKADCRIQIRPKYHRDVKTEAQNNGQPHKTVFSVMIPGGTPVEQNNNQQPQQSKGNIPVNAPDHQRICTEPFVLREEAQGNSNCRQCIYRSCCFTCIRNLIPYAPRIVEKDIEHSHGNGSDPFPAPSQTV